MEVEGGGKGKDKERLGKGREDGVKGWIWPTQKIWRGASYLTRELGFQTLIKLLDTCMMLLLGD